jgi:hypothetical protein
MRSRLDLHSRVGYCGQVWRLLGSMVLVGIVFTRMSILSVSCTTFHLVSQQELIHNAFYDCHAKRIRRFLRGSCRLVLDPCGFFSSTTSSLDLFAY